MYKIYTDGVLFCSSKVEELAIINPVIKLEVNSAGTFKFTIPPMHPYYDVLKRKKTIVDVYRDDDTEPLFEGICVSIEDDFFKQRKVVCEGELTFLNDSNLRPAKRNGLTSKQLLTAYISEHNGMVEANKHFTVGQVTAKDSNDAIYCYTNYNTTMKEIKEDLIDDIGGFLRCRHVNGVRYLDYLKDSPRTNSQVIRLGVNLLDLSTTLDSDDIATAIIPLGETLETQTIEGLDDRLTIKTAAEDSMHPANADYVYSAEAVEEYGWIEKVVEWDDVTTVSALLAKGKKYLQETQYENLVIEAKAFDLGLTDSEFQKFKLLDNIRVVSEPHGLDRYFMLSKMTINLNKPENDTITLGIETTKSLSAKANSTNSDILRKIEQLPTSNFINAAIDNATQLLTGAEGGYVVIERNANGQPIEIKIQDTLNNPTKIWRWNVNGLGYSNDGGQTYGLAMTMDGAIVADYITTGTLMGDRVKGGTFEIGGAGLAKDGKILVKNAQGTTLITIDKNGMTFSNGEKIAYSDISGTPNSVVSTHELYYKATTNDWATSPTAWITANDNTLTDQWITRKPASYDNMVRCFTCTQYKRVDGTFYNSAIDEYIAKGFSTKITKDTITTAYVNALNITAKYISTSELMATGVATIAGWKLSSNAIVSFDNTTYENSLKYCVMRRYTGNSNEAAVGIFTRNSTDENYVCQVAFRWDGSLISSDRLNVYAANSNYGMYVHGALAVSGKLHMEGGIIEGFNGISGAGEIYTSGNISGAVTNGRSGLNCTGGGLYVAGNAYVEGGLGCGGTKPRIVKTKTYGYRQMNAYETATPYFGDIGEGVTNENGECIIYFDDIFAETVDLSCNYQVFLQKYGKGDIWVEKREKDHFVVKSDCANLSFGFEIKAVQLDYETVRLDTPDYDMLEIIQKQYAE